MSGIQISPHPSKPSEHIIPKTEATSPPTSKDLGTPSDVEEIRSFSPGTRPDSPPDPQPSQTLQAPCTQTLPHPVPEIPTKGQGRPKVQPGTVAARVAALRARTSASSATPVRSSPKQTPREAQGEDRSQGTGETQGRQAASLARPEGLVGAGQAPPSAEAQSSVGAARGVDQGGMEGEAGGQGKAKRRDESCKKTSLEERDCVGSAGTAGQRSNAVSTTRTVHGHKTTSPYCRHGRRRSYSERVPNVATATNLGKAVSPHPSAVFVGSKHRTQADAASPWALVAGRASADPAFGRAVCQECAHDAEIRRDAAVDVAGKDATSSNLPSVTSVEPGLLSAPATDRDAAPLAHSQIYDAEATHLIRTLDNIIASHTAKLQSITDALRRELAHQDPASSTLLHDHTPHYRSESESEPIPIHWHELADGTHAYADSEEMARWVLGLRELMTEVDVQLEAWDGRGRWRDGAVVRRDEERRGSLYWDALDVRMT